MENESIQVRLFGSAQLRFGENSIDDKTDRSKKLWLMLAFLISRRPGRVSAAELSSVLWASEEAASGGVLKTTVHRLRSLLDRLYPGAGHGLITQESGSYRWNSEVALEVDTECFEALCENAWKEPDELIRASMLEEAVELYRGQFMERLSGEAWVVPIAAHYHNLYIRAVSELLELLQKSGERDKILALAKRAVEIDPYQEEFHRALMRIYLESGEPKAAVELYEKLRRMMLSEFGVIPEESTRALYHSAVRRVNGHIIHVEHVREQLRETGAMPGCMVCDYEFFKVLYRAEARAIARNGSCVHISLVTITGENGEDLSQRSLERAMDNMENILRENLRKGDIVSRCSASQFVVMLPQANYENSCMVSERVLRVFSRRYPHSPARLDYSVWALESAE